MANGFTIIDCMVFKQDRSNVNAPFKETPYVHGDLDNCSGLLDDSMYSVAFLARKNPGSTWNVIPQQSRYAREAAWRSGRESKGRGEP